MKINKIDYNPNYNDDTFKLENNMTVSKEEQVSKIEDIIYPMYLPENTHLTNKEKIMKYIETGNRKARVEANINKISVLVHQSKE